MTTAAHCISVRLCLEPGSDPLSGWLLAGDGERRGFLGWLGLAAALERLLEDGHADAAEQETRPYEPAQPRTDL